MAAEVTRFLWFTWALCMIGAAASILLGWIVFAFVLLFGGLWAGLKAGER